MTAQTDYQIIRNATAVHTLGAPLVRLTGDDRLEFLDGFLSKSSDFVDPDTTRECLALEDDGRPFAIMLHLELDEVSWLVPRNAVSVGELVDYLGTMDVPDGVTVEVAPSGWSHRLRGSRRVEGRRGLHRLRHFRSGPARHHRDHHPRGGQGDVGRHGPRVHLGRVRVPGHHGRR